MRTALLALLILAVPARAEDAPHWMAVGRPRLIEPLAPLAAHRASEGFQVTVSAATLEEALAFAERPPDFLLLVGDVGPEDEAWFLPSGERSLYRWRAVQPERFLSDTLLGDRDGDLLPDMAVGRLPALDPAQVRAFVAKILRFEARAPRVEDLRVVAWAGAPGYGGMLDAMATNLLVTTVQTHAPAWSDAWLISASANSALCGWPPDHPALFSAALREGCLLGAIVAHGNEQATFSMEHEGRWVAYAAPLARPHLDGDEPTPPLVLLSCDAGRFDVPGRCLAEALLDLKGGPVATIAATTESHPLTNFLTGRCLLQEMAKGPARLGTLWTAAQRAARDAADPFMERMLRDVEGKLEETIDVASLRRDQVLMYALFGDPATRLALPAALQATVERTDKGWRWRAVRVDKAERLLVFWKPKQPSPPPPRAADLEADEARRLFSEANAARAFKPLPGPEGDEPWEGLVREPGLLRLVAIGDRRIRTAVLAMPGSSRPDRIEKATRDSGQ